MTDTLYYAATDRITPRAMDVLRAARQLAYGDQEVDFVEAEPGGPGTLHFGHTGLDDSCIRTLSPGEIANVPNAQYIVAAAMRRYQFKPLVRGPIENDAGTLYLDLETRSVTEKWKHSPRDYFRLGQWAWGIEGEVFTTESFDEIVDLVLSAEVTIAHQGHLFDWSVLFGKDSMDALHLAMEGRLWDTKIHAGYNFPAPDWYVKRDGKKAVGASKPGNAVHGWFGLDNLAHVFGVPGKEGDLKALAEEFGGFDKIPLDDPRFLDYARQDIRSLQGITGSMLEFATVDDYDWREQQWGALQAQFGRNGFTVDFGAAKIRADYLENRKAELLEDLSKNYGFPSTGNMPWRTTAGKEAIVALLKSEGIDPETYPDWPRTKTGNISLGGDAITKALAGTDLEETAKRLAELMGQRSLAQLTMECVQPDGKVHPEMNALQRSGRTSVTEPGLTVFNGEDKRYYVARPGHKIVSVDYSAADARAVVAMSGDEEYAKRFEPGVDPHELTGRAAFGDEMYDSDPKKYRDGSKPIGHGSNYQIGPDKLARQIRVITGMPCTKEYAQALLDSFNKTYQKVTDWKKAIALQGERYGWITNPHGRRMPVTKGRAHTQAPGLAGQSTTREVIVDGVIRMYWHDPEFIRWIKIPVHDELIFEIPEGRLNELETIEKLMAGEVNGVAFPVQVGKPADSWFEATH